MLIEKSPSDDTLETQLPVIFDQRAVSIADDNTATPQFIGSLSALVSLAIVIGSQHASSLAISTILKLARSRKEPPGEKRYITVKLNSDTTFRIRRFRTQIKNIADLGPIHLRLGDITNACLIYSLREHNLADSHYTHLGKTIMLSELFSFRERTVATIAADQLWNTWQAEGQTMQNARREARFNLPVRRQIIDKIKEFDHFVIKRNEEPENAYSNSASTLTEREAYELFNIMNESIQDARKNIPDKV